ncbi:Ankrd17 [Symbiodinium sp. CCMP2592]|nr:Ankrd17 [Symbiodinium sp. CCMP2592]
MPPASEHVEAPAMLRIWLASGEELPPISREKIRVWDLKHYLRREHGFPFCMQRLICGGDCLSDKTDVAAPCELQLMLSMEAGSWLDAGTELVSFAANTGHVEATRRLLQVCNDQVCRCKALSVAALQGRTEVARLLVKARADTNVPDTKGKTALIHAASAGHTEIAGLLLESGAAADMPDPYGMTALMHAAYSGHVKVVHLLLDAGANKDACDRGGKSALAHALCNGHITIAHLLLDAGASKKLPDLDRKCYASLGLAAPAGDLEIIQLLLDAGADCSEALLPAACHGHSEIVRVLLDAGADKNACALDGKSVLDHAASNGHIQVVRLLVEAGAAGE